MSDDLLLRAMEVYRQAEAKRNALAEQDRIAKQKAKKERLNKLFREHCALIGIDHLLEEHSSPQVVYTSTRSDLPHGFVLFEGGDEICVMGSSGGGLHALIPCPKCGATIFQTAHRISSFEDFGRFLTCAKPNVCLDCLSADFDERKRKFDKWMNGEE